MMISLLVLYATMAGLVGWVMHWANQQPCPCCRENSAPKPWFSVVTAAALWPATICLFVWDLVFDGRR